MWEAEWSCVCFYGLSASANLSRAVFPSPPLTLHVCLCFRHFHNFAPLSLFSSFALGLPLSRVYICDVSVRLKQSLCASVGCGYLRVALLSVSEWSRNSKPPPPLLTSLTEGYQSRAWCVSHRAGGTDFPSAGFYLCLNVTALKAQNSLLAEVSFTFYPHFSYLRPLTTTLNHPCVLSGTFDAPSVAREHRRAAKTFLC